MGLKEWAALLRGEDRLVELADQIAGECLNLIWPKVETQIAEMQLAEARGYVRARARVQVKRSIEGSSEARLLGVERVIAATLDELSRMAIARSLEAPQPVYSPMSLRRAA